MFKGCSNLKEIKGLNNLITNNVTNMESMFDGCSNLKELNINNFKVNKECILTDIFNQIDKTKCNLITKEEKLKNLFLN